MNFARETVTDAAVGVGVTKSHEGLSSIHHPGCAATIWQRAPAPDFQDWIDDLDPEHLPRIRMILAPDQVREALQKTALMCGTPDCPQCGMLVDDIAALAMIFADVMTARFVRLRLDVVTHNACRKFHIDAVKARLICTYRGTGTQYGISTDGEDPSRVFTVPACAPIILRGTQWPEGPKSGLLHRSPPIEGSGETRLLLVIDPVDEAPNDNNTIH
ncbi:MAG: DUF1826 domain-containing protein [Pseudomonadota bacterium]